MSQECHKDNLLISTDPAKLDLDVIRELMKQYYWAENIPQAVIKNAVQNSLCFGIYRQQTQIGFARVITDYATIAYIADVFLLEDVRKRELLKWLMECIVTHPSLQMLKQWFFASKEGLYAKFKYIPLETAEQLVETYVAYSASKRVNTGESWHR
ncbi:GNAT family N-acetyltransferase [candidate division KSB3 bacterium]|uniref:GNAT family N-acetyltransferase n=1 Tax=candidate division KSB3 bacterium TaxID=2044937 RepID=A0A9D5Q566_9BACT|nr:GNAT family N-acetyltransferase [candidate division KSB3 bacterium]MBD3323937.1 GNAT family N-acetyltransferase [candidate division KSB3 bacterium]